MSSPHVVPPPPHPQSFRPKPFSFAKGDMGCVRMLHRVVLGWIFWGNCGVGLVKGWWVGLVIVG